MSEETKSPSNHNAGMDMTQGHIGRNLIKFAIPMLAGSALQTAYAIVNTIWVGNGLGKDAVAAMAVSFPIIFFLMAIAGGLTLASSILVSQSYGAKNYARMKQVIHNSLFLTLCFSGLLVLAGYFTAYPLLKVMGTPAAVMPMAKSYLQIFIWTIPFMFIMFLYMATLRGVGDSITPLYFQAAGVILTGILDPFMMFGWLFFPKLGLNGTAWATIITNALGVVTLIMYLEHKKHIVNPEWKHLKADFPTSWLTIKLGVPTMIQQALVSLGMLMIMGLINEYGENGIAAFGIAMRIDQLAFLPSMTIGMAASTLAGQNIGAKRYDRVHDVFRWGLFYGVGMTSIVTILCLTVPHFLLRFFVKDPVVIHLGENYLRIIGGGYLLLAVLFLSNGVINGAGHTFATTIFSLVGLWIVRIPLAAYFSHHMHRLEGIWIAMVISFAIGTSLSCLYYYSGRWKKPVGKMFSRTPKDEISLVD
jgi:putative MATE family efflux protein